MYNYRVCSTPRTKPRPLPSTPHSTSRPKKFHKEEGLAGGGANSEGDELSQFRELYPSSTVEEDDEAIFKKPKPKVGVASNAPGKQVQRILRENVATKLDGHGEQEPTLSPLTMSTGHQHSAPYSCQQYQ